jgi:hypothetical protein
MPTPTGLNSTLTGTLTSTPTCTTRANNSSLDPLDTAPEASYIESMLETESTQMATLIDSLPTSGPAVAHASNGEFWWSTRVRREFPSLAHAFVALDPFQAVSPSARSRMLDSMCGEVYPAHLNHCVTRSIPTYAYNFGPPFSPMRREFTLPLE